MKKAILIFAILVVALVGLASYNGKEVKKETANGTLFAELKGNKTGVGGGEGGKKQD